MNKNVSDVFKEKEKVNIDNRNIFLNIIKSLHFCFLYLNYIASIVFCQIFDLVFFIYLQ